MGIHCVLVLFDIAAHQLARNNCTHLKSGAIAACPNPGWNGGSTVPECRKKFSQDCFDATRILDFFFSFGRSTSFQLSRVTHPSDYQAQLGTTSLSSWVMVSVSDQGLPGPVSVEGVWVVKPQVRTRDGASIEAWKLDRGSRQQLRSVTPLGAPATQSLEKNRQCSCNRPGS